MSITFRVFVDSEQLKDVSDRIKSDSFSGILASELQKQDITADVSSAGSVQVSVVTDKPVGTVKQVGGVYRVVDCPRGYLLVNNTIPGSCLACERYLSLPCACARFLFLCLFEVIQG